MKQVLDFIPAFNPAARTLDFTGFTLDGGFALRKLHRIVNITRDETIFLAGSRELGAIQAGSVLTLDFNVTGHAATDVLQVEYDLPTASGGGGGSGTSDTTEATQLQVRTAVQAAAAALGAPGNEAADSDSGAFSLIALTKRLLGKFGVGQKAMAQSLAVTLASDQSPLAVGSFTAKFREAFEAFPNANWAATTAAGDIVAIDGNAGGASYLVISKSPFGQNTQSVLESVASFGMPIEFSIGAHMSQRTLGQQFAIEIVSTEPPVAPPADLAISSIQQAASTLTVTTAAAAHNLRPGQRISIYGCADSRMNYPALVVATTPTPNTFTVAAGPMGNLPALAAGPFNTGFVAARSAMNYARNGTTMLFEAANVGQASFYAKSEGGDAMPIGGTVAGSHSVAIASTASVQAIAAALTYAFRPTSEYRLALLADRLQWQDVGVDATGQATARATLTQVIPNPDLAYKVRVRAENLRSLTVPVAEIVSVTKSGTTTATVVCAGPHGLAVGDVINIFGVRDQANFANLSAATAIAAVVDATTFTVVWGAAVAATSFGGYVARVNGGQVMQGAVAQSVQNASVTAGILTLVGSAAWAGLQIGDYVNLDGCRNNVNGGNMNLDGAYRTRDLSGTSLVLEPIGDTPAPATLAATDCGGAIIKRTDLRISFVRVFDYERLRVEALSRPSGDIAGAMPVAVQNTPAVSISGTPVLGAGANTIGNVGIANGQGAEDAVVAGNAVRVGGRVRTAHPTTFIANDAADVTMTTGGAAVVKPYGVPEADWQYTGVLTTVVAAAMRAAPAAGLRAYLTGLTFQNTGATPTTLLIQDGAATIAQFNAPAAMTAPAPITFPTPLKGTAATALNVICGTAGANVLVNAQGYIAP